MYLCSSLSPVMSERDISFSYSRYRRHSAQGLNHQVGEHLTKKKNELESACECMKYYRIQSYLKLGTQKLSTF